MASSWWFNIPCLWKIIWGYHSWPPAFHGEVHYFALTSLTSWMRSVPLETSMPRVNALTFAIGCSFSSVPKDLGPPTWSIDAGTTGVAENGWQALRVRKGAYMRSIERNIFKFQRGFHCVLNSCWHWGIWSLEQIFHAPRSVLLSFKFHKAYKTARDLGGLSLKLSNLWRPSACWQSVWGSETLHDDRDDD